MDVKKEKKRKKDKTMIEKEMFVFVYFFYVCYWIKEKNEFNILIYMHKYLKDR